ncbi:hypothetical protein SR38_09660 [Atlantibacter hermannii]|nr:hypothetical protein SR38_09660 [Atlantibacter hermannii]
MGEGSSVKGTGVEKTDAHRPPLYEGQRHLHVRGEDQGSMAFDDIDLETPPRAWRRPHRLLTA